MDANAYALVMGATLAGGLTGALVVWQRNRRRIAGKSRWLGIVVLLAGMCALLCGLLAFRRVLGPHSAVYAAVVVIQVTAAAAIAQSVFNLPAPARLLSVSGVEYDLLRREWTGIGAFGRLLASTPLRHLGGQVYFSKTNRDPLRILDGIYAAEKVHLWAFGCSLPWLIAWASRAHWSLVAVGLAVHAPLNVLPVLHLRRSSYRLQRHISASRRGRSTRTNPRTKPPIRA